MADDRHYVGGEWYRICERTGFKLRNVRTRKEWTGRIVRDQSWERRQPQDLVQGVTDDQNVYEPRPRQLDQYIGPLESETAAPSVIGSQVIVLATNARWLPGDQVRIMLDDGTMFLSTINNLPSGGTSIQIVDKLPFKVSKGNTVVNYTAVSVPVYPTSGTAL